MPTSTAAAPTKLWRIATNSGIDVICTRDASSAPIAAPGISAAASSPKPPTSRCAAVAASAMSMPAIPNRFPRRAVSWCDRPPRLRMNSALAAM